MEWPHVICEDLTWSTFITYWPHIFSKPVMSSCCRFNKTPVIMASGRELCYVLLFGFISCYGMTFIMVAKPTIYTCTLLRLGLGLSLAICYAALFTKTNRISRIFNRGVKAMVKRPSYTSPRSQLMIVGLLVAVQVMGALTWIAMDLPGTTYLYPDRETVVLRCKSTNFAIVMSLLYNMILIIMCTVYAFKTRKIPENYNEAKYIAFTMYSTCIVWLAFIPIYFGTKNDFKVRCYLLLYHTTALAPSIGSSQWDGDTVTGDRVGWNNSAVDCCNLKDTPTTLPLRQSDCPIMLLHYNTFKVFFF